MLYISELEIKNFILGYNTKNGFIPKTAFIEFCENTKNKNQDSELQTYINKINKQKRLKKKDLCLTFQK